MTLRSRLIGIQDLQPHDSVGYGAAYTATRAHRIGVVACGYADGYPRHAPNGTPVMVCGRMTRLAGRVSMDLLTVDLSDIPEARVGSPVVLWGEGVPVDDVAAAAGTVGYELLCALASRVPVVVSDTGALDLEL
jgi:alanine racemase